jgi:hypothetical protein
MPKVSKATASSHYQLPGVMESFEDETEGWNISFSTYSMEVDQAFLFKGAPNDQCQATHMGYILKGKMAIRTADGSEEVYEAGDAFVMRPGHTPIVYAGLEMLAFTSAEDANWQAAVMMPNLKNYLEEHGMEVPPEFQAQP